MQVTNSINQSLTIGLRKATESKGHTSPIDVSSGSTWSCHNMALNHNHQFVKQTKNYLQHALANRQSYSGPNELYIIKPSCACIHNCHDEVSFWLASEYQLSSSARSVILLRQIKQIWSNWLLCWVRARAPSQAPFECENGARARARTHFES